MWASDAIETLVLADVDEGAARRLAAEDAAGKAFPRRVDAGEGGALREAMRGLDIVVNAAIPRFNRGIQEAALAEGLDYIDLAADSADPYARSADWEAAGRTGIIGMGEDPGLSNVMARRAADGMDRVDAIKVRDGDTASSPEHPFICLFSPETFVEETLAHSKIWRDGVYETVPPFGALETYDFPAPVGPLPVYSVDHEEVDSLPRFIGKGVRYVDFKLALDGVTVETLRRYQAVREAARAAGDDAAARRAFFASIPSPAALVGRIDGYAALLVEVSGISGGRRKVHVQYALIGHKEASERHRATGTAYMTGTPAAVATLLLAEGRIRRPGLLAPELLDPEPFFPMLEDRGIRVDERITWDPPA
ncbi:MAG: hypothetical protein A3K59_05565 [Euryarchaeota archaeon RBG_19FT_COMBO_69_17]|nr:MAG: hypothetical protein A3K59_05565 [Euryarchaeota archaeon RBG_19FT_COMBO_69_17]